MTPTPSNGDEGGRGRRDHPTGRSRAYALNLFGIFVALFKLAARNLARHHTRTVISLSAVAFGVAALMLAGGFSEWIFWAMREGAIQTGLGHIQISRPGFRDTGAADPAAYLLPPDASALASVRQAPSVTVVDERLLLSGLASSGETTVAFTGEAVDPEADHRISKVLTVNGDNLASGDPAGVLAGSGLARTLGIKRGDTVSFLVSLPGGSINGVEGHVRGIFTTGFKAYDDAVVRMPLALGRQLLRVKGAHVWVVGLDDTERTGQVIRYLHEHLSPERFEVASWLELSDFYRKTVDLLSRQIRVVGILIAIIIVLGISNTFTMNVMERTGEIGTLMALGTTRRSIMALFIAEGVLLGVAGGVIGLTVGFGLGELLSLIGIPMPPPPGRTESYSAKIMLTFPLAAWSLLLALVAAPLASIYPAWKASRLTIVDALRHNR
jgi:ABC-type transport system, involved in lipoprotein release, permease component